MLDALVAVHSRALSYRRAKRRTSKSKTRKADWRALQLRQFVRKYRQGLGTSLKCKKCSRQAMYVPGKVTQPSDSELVNR